MAVGVAGGNLYVIGGFLGGPAITTNEAYDPTMDSWSTKAPMPTGREFRGNAPVVNGLIYLIGGNASGSCTSAVQAYNPTTNTWATKAPMPTPRCHLAVVALNGIIYALGGTNTSGTIKYAIVEAYNPTTNTWATKAPMPTGRQDLGAAVANGLLYALGGFAGIAGNVATNEVYDPTTNSWTTKAPMPSPRSGFAVGVINNVLYAIGGTPDGSSHLVTTEAYNPATDSWSTRASMPTPRAYLGAGVLNNIIYAVGGADANGQLSTNEAFVPTNLQCIGFEPPFNTPIALKRKTNRAIPLKMELFHDSTPITDFNIPGGAPVVNVAFSAGGGPATDVTDQLEPLGQSSEGNEFRFDAVDGHWVFNLGTKPFSAAGTYTVTVEPGDTSYDVLPTCTGQFVRSE